MNKRNSILTETIISKDTFFEFEHNPNNNINIQHRNIEFRASHSPVPNFNKHYSSKNTVLTNPKTSSGQIRFGVEGQYETGEEVNDMVGGDHVLMGPKLSFNATDTSQEFDTFKRGQSSNAVNKQQVERVRGQIKNIQCMFPQEYCQEDIIRSQLNNIFMDQIRELNKELKSVALECATFQAKIKQKLQREERIQNDKLKNDLIIKVTEKIEKMERDENYLREKLKRYKEKMVNLEKINEDKTKEISDILSRVDLSISKNTFNRNYSRKFEIKCTGKCKYRKEGSYDKSLLSTSNREAGRCTCFESQEPFQRDSSISSTKLEKKLSIEKNKRQFLENELKKYKKTHSQISIQNLGLIEENQKNKKLLLQEKEKTKEIKNQFKSKIDLLKKDLYEMEKNQMLTSINVSPDFRAKRFPNSKRQFSGERSPRPAMSHIPGKNILSNRYFLFCYVPKIKIKLTW
jgi:hypothetical protein